MKTERIYTVGFVGVVSSGGESIVSNGGIDLHTSPSTGLEALTRRR